MDLIEKFIGGFIGALGIIILFVITYLLYISIRKFYGIIYEKIYKKSYWTKEKEEKANLEKEKAKILQNKEKIVEDNTARKMDEKGLDLDRDWQEYYKIRNEEMNRLNEQIKEMNKKFK